MPINETCINAFANILGPSGLISNSNEMGPYLHEERGLAIGHADLVARPANVSEVSSVVKLCAREKIPIIPVGGSTGLVGGTLAHGGLVLATDRLNRIIEVDPINKTITAECGCILANLQTKAAEHNCLFPLSLGAEGSCRIGGNISTNAGGINVLRYGNVRNLVLGLEVVLPSGEIWNGLNTLRKDNTGYDLKQLFIGAEGTLGIITKATLKLFPAPKMSATVLAALPDLSSILKLFRTTQDHCGEHLTAFELIPRIGIELTVTHMEGILDPFNHKYPFYALIELTSSQMRQGLHETIETVMSKAVEEGIVIDAVFAKSESQSNALWRIREEIPAAQSREGGSIKHDVSVPVSKTVEFISKATSLVSKLIPNIRPCPFGHIGDGNIHYNLTQPRNMDKETFINKTSEVNRLIHDLVTNMGGSISAEHGIGSFKLQELAHYAEAQKVNLMRTLKEAIDPRGIMNPGKII